MGVQTFQCSLIIKSLKVNKRKERGRPAYAVAFLNQGRVIIQGSISTMSDNTQLKHWLGA